MGPGGAAGLTGGEQPQGLGQPLPGAYSVELPNEEAKEEEPYKVQPEEMRRRKRRSRLILTACYHACDGDCNHGLTPLPPKHAQPPVNLKPKSWFPKYAELELVEVGAGGPEVNEVPMANCDTNFEVISVTVDSGAYNTVGPPKWHLL